MTDREIIKAIHQRLVEAAKRDQNEEDAFVFYSEIIQMAGIGHLGEGVTGALGHVFYEVNEYDRAQDPNRPMLSAVAVSAERSVGGGFYVLARDYGKYSGKNQRDKDEFWMSELKALREYWNTYSDDVIKCFLLTWNPKLFPWEKVRKEWDDYLNGDTEYLSWSCSNTKRIRYGDRVYLMRVGVEPKGIIGVGDVVSERPYRDYAEHNQQEQNYIDLKPFLLRDPDLQGVIDPRFLDTDYNWTPMGSGVEIPGDVAEELSSLILEINDSSDGQRITEVFVEGRRKRVVAYQIERNPQARRLCINHYGTTCTVCGFNFEEEFGSIGEGYIHVHHLNPISEINEQHEIDPVKDLRPVCPNCHAMLHRSRPPLSIEELQQIMKRKR